MIGRDRPSRRQIRTALSVRGDVLTHIRGSICVGERATVDGVLAPSHLVVGRDGRLAIGSDVHMAHGLALACHESVDIGERTTVGPFVSIADTDFHVVGATAMPTPRPVSIGTDVAIGAHSTILAGARIGDGVVVRPGSVVGGNIETGITVGGNPATAASDRAATDAQRSVSELITALFDLDATPHPDDSPLTVTSWDSLGTLRLVMALEREFDIRIDESTIAETISVADWESLVEQLSNRGTPIATVGP